MTSPVSPSIWRTLRAFAWLRWRVLINSLERRGSRDVLERFSVAFEELVPAIVALMMLPSAAALAGLGTYAGWTLGGGQPSGAFGLARLVLFAACALTVVGPIVLPAAERTNAVRLLLLPIPRTVLYLSQSMSAVADPWILLAAVLVIAIPVGIAVAGNGVAAALALAAGLLFVLALIGLSQLATSAVHLIIRDRRRAELFGVLIVVVLPVMAMLPGLLQGGRHRSNRPPLERSQPAENGRWSAALQRSAIAVVPSEIYARTARSATTAGAAGATLRSFATLTGVAIVFHGLAMLLLGWVLGSPGAIASTRSTAAATGAGWRIPGSSPAVSAVAVNQLRLALRTPRGRTTLLSPVMMFGLFTIVMLRGNSAMDFGPLRMESGLGLAGMASFMAMLSAWPLTMNQFAIDRAGLTMAMLAPLETGALLRGKAIGNGLIMALPTAICLAAAAVVFPSGDPILWLCLPLTLVAANLLVAPVAAMVSAVFPRAVDLNSIGRGSNAHGAAGLLGLLAMVAAVLPAIAIVFVMTRLAERPALAPVALLVWMAICLAISAGLFRAAAALFERRRENLSMTAIASR